MHPGTDSQPSALHNQPIVCQVTFDTLKGFYFICCCRQEPDREVRIAQVSRKKSPHQPAPRPGGSAPSGEERSTKWILWDHFSDIALLIILELILQVGLDQAVQISPRMAELQEYTHLFSKWFCFAAFTQFGI